jgi:enamidase
MKTLITNIGQIASGDSVATDARATHRIIVGNDAPSGTGVIPLGVLRTLSLLAGLGGMDPATGSVARDAFSASSAGDLPGISMVLIDGKITIGRSRNTPPAARAAEVVKGSGPSAGGH